MSMIMVIHYIRKDKKRGWKYMDSTTIICNCKKVTYGAIENVIRESNLLSDVLKAFDEVQRVTHCSTGCGGCHDKILDIIADFMYQR